jgi:hypothetical protein
MLEIGGDHRHLVTDTYGVQPPASSTTARNTRAVKVSIEDLFASPIGVSLLDRLEAEHRPESFLPFEAFPDSNPIAVREAAEQVMLMSLGRLLASPIDASGSLNE